MKVTTVTRYQVHMTLIKFRSLVQRLKSASDGQRHLVNAKKTRNQSHQNLLG